ncbi:acyltransferase family protein [Sphingomonas jeddahensis]|uniref:Acyltransferase family protein n=1 Tax=Sphingomonas jeddahensis TaxID=1915074 RepID=A0A1V2EW84_9SPHN|nr:acyltransferase family protein [Sphingomonas jeddahensis]ONF96414.1 Acyltransferase family protein [Sphingomonas jeddahensis]
MGERIDWLDTARGFGIVAVVAGHVTSDPAVWAATFHFHMPLFFMLSGMVFTPKAFADVAHRRARTLLLPYAMWLVIVAGLDVLVALTAGHPMYLPWERPAAALARMLLGGTFLVGPFGIFWFVTCLYVVQLAAVLILRRPPQQVLIIAVLLLAVTHVIPRMPNPWGLVSVPAATFFFVAGALHRRHADALGWPLTAIALGAGSLAAVSRPLDLKIAEVGTPVLSIVAALGLCHLILTVAKRAPSVSPIAALGRASLVIMYGHLTLFYALRDHMGKAAVAALCALMPLGLWLILRRFPAARALLLGEWLLDRRPPVATAQAPPLPFRHEQA